MRKEEKVIPLHVLLNPIDKHILDEMSKSLQLSYTDVVKVSLWNYVNVPKDGFLSETLKEMARSREISFRMDLLKELERTNNRQIFFIDGFRTMLDAWKSRRISTSNGNNNEGPISDLRDKLNARAGDLRVKLNRSKPTDLRRQLERAKGQPQLPHPDTSAPKRPLRLTELQASTNGTVFERHHGRLP